MDLRRWDNLQLPTTTDDFENRHGLLADETSKAIGGERLLYERDLWNEGGFAGSQGFENAARLSRPLSSWRVTGRVC